MHRFVTKRIAQDHSNIGSVLSLMRIQLDFLSAENPEGLALLSTATSYLVNFPGVMHHPLEEVMLEAVLANDPAAAGMRGRLLSEHGQLTTAAADFTARIGLQQLDRGKALDDLQRQGTEYITAYGEHIQFEEAEVMPKALDTLSDRQWQDVRARFVVGRDPLFSPERLAFYENLYDAMMGEAGRITKEPDA